MLAVVTVVRISCAVSLASVSSSELSVIAMISLVVCLAIVSGMMAQQQGLFQSRVASHINQPKDFVPYESKSYRHLV